MLYKLLEDWGGFAAGQVIEVCSESRLLAMRSGIGVPYELEPVTEPENVLVTEPVPAAKRGRPRGTIKKEESK